MKKLILIAAVMVALAVHGSLFAAGSCVETVVKDASSNLVTVKLACTGDATDGTIPTQTVSSGAMGLVRDKYLLYLVTAYPTPSGTAPDAADVAVLMNGFDLLGAKGVNLINASATQDVKPYSTFLGDSRYPAITNALTLTVANQATVSANYTIELVFLRP